MKYWIKVIMESSECCRSCGRVIGYGQVAYRFIDEEEIANRPAVCINCLGQQFPNSVEVPKL